MPARSIFSLRSAFIAASLFALLGGAWYWSDHRAPPPAAGSERNVKEPGKGAGKKPQPVRIAPVQQIDIHVWLDALGTVAPRNLVTVRPRVDGALQRVVFREGKTVKAGELLAEIDPRPFQIALKQAEGQMARDAALLDNARLDLERYQALLARDAIPRQQVETQAALVRQYQGALAADRSQVDHARLQLDYTRITAPAAGRIGLRLVDAGNQVRTADANGIASIAQVQPIAVLFSVPEAHLPALNRRLAARAAVEVEAWDRSRKTLLGRGQVATTDNQIDAATGTIKVKAEFANRDSALFPNQFVNVRLRLDTLKQTLAAPTAAILRGENGSFVYRLDGAGKVAMRPVTPGPMNGELMAVSGDLAAGDQVVIDGLDKLRDGARVEVVKPGGKGGKGGKGERGKGGGGKKPE